MLVSVAVLYVAMSPGFIVQGYLANFQSPILIMHDIWKHYDLVKTCLHYIEKKCHGRHRT